MLYEVYQQFLGRLAGRLMHMTQISLAAMLATACSLGSAAGSITLCFERVFSS
jgi:hypothetical protein